MPKTRANQAASKTMSPQAGTSRKRQVSNADEVQNKRIKGNEPSPSDDEVPKPTKGRKLAQKKVKKAR